MKVLEQFQASRVEGLEVQVREFARGLITSGKLKRGSRLPATKELAQLWGVGHITVQNALAPLVKEGLLIRRPKAGTFVRRGQEKLTCVAVYDTAGNIRDSLFEQALQAALKEELTALGIEMDVWLDARPAREHGAPWMPLVRAAERREFQALIATRSGWPLLQWLQQLPVPTAFATSAELPNAVASDLTQFAALSVQALAQQGCRSVGLICPCSPALAAAETGLNRWGKFVGHFISLARDWGMTVQNEWMRMPPRADFLVGRSQESYGYECFQAVWNQPERPAGLVVFSDTVARGVILAAREMQVRVPADLKLALGKNESIDLFCPMPAMFVVSSEQAIAKALIQQVQKQFRGEPCEPINVPFRLMAHPAAEQTRCGAHGGNSPQPTTRPQEGNRS